SYGQHMSGFGGQAPHEPPKGQGPYPSGHQQWGPNPHQMPPPVHPPHLPQPPQGGAYPMPSQPPAPPFTPPPPPAPPPPQTRQDSGEPGFASYLWALTPLFTCGFGTPLTMLLAAVKRRSSWLGMAAAAYTLGIITWIVTAAAYDSADEMPFPVVLLMFV